MDGMFETDGWMDGLKREKNRGMCCLCFFFLIFCFSVDLFLRKKIIKKRTIYFFFETIEKKTKIES